MRIHNFAAGMPDPKKLKIGDRVRFVAIPDEWAEEKFWVHPETRRFMQAMIARRFPSRVAEVDDDGIPVIRALLRLNNRIEHHSWSIIESTGWRLVRLRE